jgi:signal transduction histidine kinase
MEARIPDLDIGRAGYLRTTFLVRVAHELRGPAGVTLGALHEIERALGSEVRELQPLLGMARRGVRRVLRTADRLDRTAQLEAKEPAWRKAAIDLRSLVAEVARETVLLEARSGVRLDSSETEEPCFIDADGSWVRAAVAELIANAVRFSRTRVSVETRCIDREAHVIILDDGPGFDGVVQARFEPPLTSHGLGLSLPLVQEVAHAYGGRLEFRDTGTDGSSGAGGTCVRLIFPLALGTARAR